MSIDPSHRRPRKLDLQIEGRRLEAVFYGPPPDEAATLVLLHEGLGSVSTWRTFPAELAAETGLGVVGFSRVGYGHSDPADLPRPLRYMHEEALDVLPEVLGRAGLERAVLVGHSDGGSIALIHAGSRRMAACVEGLVLLAPHVFCEQVSVRAIEQAKALYLQGDLRKRLALHHLHVDIAFWGWNRAWLDPDFLQWNIEEYLPRVKVPVVVLQGDRDPYGTWQQVTAIQQGVRGRFRSLELPGIGHSPWKESGAQTIAAISELAREIFG